MLTANLTKFNGVFEFLNDLFRWSPAASVVVSSVSEEAFRVKRK